jgi:hypothetical protein
MIKELLKSFLTRHNIVVDKEPLTARIDSVNDNELLQ